MYNNIYINIALNKISRDTGEDEFEAIISLEEISDIRIISKETSHRITNQIGIMILEPFDDKKYDNIKNSYMSNFSFNLFKKYVKILILNEKVYIEYPIFIDISIVHDELFEDLKEEHCIISDNFSESQWEQLQNTELWRKAEIQVSREIIGNKLLSNSL